MYHAWETLQWCYHCTALAVGICQACRHVLRYWDVSRNSYVRIGIIWWMQHFVHSLYHTFRKQYWFWCNSSSELLEPHGLHLTCPCHATHRTDLLLILSASEAKRFTDRLIYCITSHCECDRIDAQQCMRVYASRSAFFCARWEVVMLN